MNHKQMSKKGGKAKTEAKRKASQANVAKARAVRLQKLEKSK